MIGFKSITHQGWFHAKHGGDNPYPQFVNSKSQVTTSAFGEYVHGQSLFHQGKSWKEYNRTD